MKQKKERDCVFLRNSETVDPDTYRMALTGGGVSFSSELGQSVQYFPAPEGVAARG